MILTARELAFRLHMHEGELKRKLCNYQIQKWIIYTHLKAPHAIELNEDSLYVLEKFVIPKSHTLNREKKLKAFEELKEEILKDERKKKQHFNCF